MLARLIAESSTSRGFRHSVISLTSVGSVGAELQRAGVEVRALGLKTRRAGVLGFWRLRRQLRALQPDIVHTWMYHADFLGGLAAMTLGVRNVVWCIRTTYIDAESSRITRLLARVCAGLSRFVPRVIICAAEASRRAHAALGYDVTRMIVVNNGFDTARLAAGAEARDGMRAGLGFHDDAVAIIAAGRFTPVKDFKNFVSAAKFVAEQVPNARFVIAGRGAVPQNAELMSWLAEANLLERFVLLGERVDMPECLGAMDVFCLSSRSEGFPNVVGEAMAVGVPCVVTDVGDAAFLVDNTGEVVPKEDPKALGEALTRMATLSPAERRALGQAARLRIEQQFSMESSRLKFEAAYRKLLARGSVAD